MYDLTGKRAIVTGAAQGIGKAIATRLAAEGCDLGILDIDGDAASRTAEELSRGGRAVHARAADVTRQDSVEAAITDMAERLGGVDILVNNAGVLKLASILEMEMDDWRRTFQVNVEGMVMCAKVVLPGMIERRDGRIVNLASWMGKQGVENYGAYCASKAAVISMTQSLALEVAPSGVHVNAVCPGLIVDTRMREDSDLERASRGMGVAADRAGTIPLRRVGVPDDVARVAVFLASDEAAYMTGQAINVTGGMWMN